MATKTEFLQRLLSEIGELAGISGKADDVLDTVFSKNAGEIAEHGLDMPNLLDDVRAKGITPEALQAHVVTHFFDKGHIIPPVRDRFLAQLKGLPEPDAQLADGVFRVDEPDTRPVERAIAVEQETGTAQLEKIIKETEVEITPPTQKTPAPSANIFVPELPEKAVPLTDDMAAKFDLQAASARRISAYRQRDSLTATLTSFKESNPAWQSDAAAQAYVARMQANIDIHNTNYNITDARQYALERAAKEVEKVAATPEAPKAPKAPKAQETPETPAAAPELVDIRMEDLPEDVLVGAGLPPVQVEAAPFPSPLSVATPPVAPKPNVAALIESNGIPKSADDILLALDPQKATALKSAQAALDAATDPDRVRDCAFILHQTTSEVYGANSFKKLFDGVDGIDSPEGKRLLDTATRGAERKMKALGVNVDEFEEKCVADFKAKQTAQAAGQTPQTQSAPAVAQAAPTASPAQGGVGVRATPKLDKFYQNHPNGRFDVSGHNETGKGLFSFINHKDVGVKFTELLTDPTRKIAVLMEKVGSGFREITDPAELKRIFSSKQTDFGNYYINILPGNGSLGAVDMANTMLNASSSLPGAITNFRNVGGNKIMGGSEKLAPQNASVDLIGTCDDFVKQFFRRNVNKALEAGDTASAERVLDLLSSVEQTMHPDNSAWKGATGFIKAFNDSNINSASFSPSLTCQKMVLDESSRAGEEFLKKLSLGIRAGIENTGLKIKDAMPWLDTIGTVAKHVYTNPLANLPYWFIKKAGTSQSNWIKGGAGVVGAVTLAGAAALEERVDNINAIKEGDVTRDSFSVWEAAKNMAPLQRDFPYVANPSLSPFAMVSNAYTVATDGVDNAKILLNNGLENLPEFIRPSKFETTEVPTVQSVVPSSLTQQELLKTLKDEKKDEKEVNMPEDKTKEAPNQGLSQAELLRNLKNGQQGNKDNKTPQR